MIEPTRYFKESQVTINHWKTILDSQRGEDGKLLTQKDKIKIRGKIAALRTRCEKKLEVSTLKEQIDVFKDSLEYLLIAMNDEFSAAVKKKVTNDLAESEIQNGKYLITQKNQDFDTTIRRFMRIWHNSLLT